MSYFWSGITLDDFLIQGLNISSYPGFTTLILVIFVASALLEGIRTCRDVLMARFLQLQRRELLVTGSKTFKVQYAKTTTILSAKNNWATTRSKIKPTHIELELPSPTGNSPSCKTHPPTSDDMNNDVDGVLSSAKRWSSCFTMLVATMCHMIYVFVGYTLMLCAMTFNVWILCGVVFGSGCGYFIFYHVTQIIRLKQGCRNLTHPSQISSQ